MTDPRRQAAEEWALRETEGQEQYNIAVAAHLAGQEVGEKREREAERAATVAWLRMIEKRTRDYSRPSTESLLVADEYDYIARTIMSGEHRGGE